MEFSYFDIVVSIIVLFLGLKGIINGFFKELFGLLGIVGGIFIASRVGDDVGQVISDSVFKFENSAAIGFTGFLVTLAIFWLLMVVVGLIFKKLSSVSGLGIFDKILGFVFSAGKFFLIAAVISYAAYNIKAMRTNIDSMMQNSFVFPVLVEVGSVIMKLDPVEISEDINATIQKGSQAVQESIDENIKESTAQIIDDAKKKIIQSAEQNLSTKEEQ
ncbi:CvpA family protein [Sulfurimonas sp.]|jgi:membrane protein required for colicin V production|uniref:CvpA family protein n=1 Tax=Sulfurimonas sp. TaxID=2022749 RepID=UPI002A36A2D4|nr:CvpA family protein [Sulfurimonas sp.]MDY0123233.1 CvpA family protein [Sulfurimonas sp.]